MQSSPRHVVRYVIVLPLRLDVVQRRILPAQVRLIQSQRA